MITVKDSEYIVSISYENAEDFLKSISYKGDLYDKLSNGNFVFRGHSTDEYKLLPTALRPYFAYNETERNSLLSESDKKLYSILSSTEFGQIMEERRLLEQFFLRCDENGLYVPHIETLRNSFMPGFDVEKVFGGCKWLPKDYWELAALAQHHGVKTRLLDWSYDFFVALYFSTTGVFKDRSRFDELESSLYVQRSKTEKFAEKNMEIWALDDSVFLVNPTKNPLKIVKPRYHDNDYLCAQKGCFTFWESEFLGVGYKDKKEYLKNKTDRRALDEQLDSYLKSINHPTDKKVLYQITISQSAAREIYDYIDKMGYNASKIFPGYDGVVKAIEERKRILNK